MVVLTTSDYIQIVTAAIYAAALFEDSDYVIHGNELGIDLEKSINSKITSIYIICDE